MVETMACHECEASVQGAARWLVLSEPESSRGEEVDLAHYKKESVVYS